MVKTEKTKTLLIADPHLGWEMQLQEKGIHVPSQTPKILNKLTAIITEYKPDSLVILGDVKYTVVSHEFGEWQDIPDFFNKLEGYIGSISVMCAVTMTPTWNRFCQRTLSFCLRLEQ